MHPMQWRGLRDGYRTACTVALVLASAPHILASQTGPAVIQTPRWDLERFQLANGLDVVLHRLAHVPMVTVMTTYRVGSRDERDGRSGFAHLFEHLMFKGSRYVPAGKFAEWLVEAGGGANGATARDRTVYATWAAAGALELALYLDAERMAFLADGLTRESVDVERDVVKNERRERVDNRPYGDAFIILGGALFGAGHPYAHPPIGSMEDIDRARLSELLDFHRTYYVPNNATLVVVGDIDVPTARALVTKWYGAIPPGPVPPRLTLRTSRPDAVVRLVKEERVSLPRVYVGWVAPAEFDSGDAELGVIASLLTRGASGRLRARLVGELGIAQSVGVVHERNDLASLFYVWATARPGVGLDTLERAIMAETRRLRDDLVDETELARITGVTTANLLAGVESTGGRADRLSLYMQSQGTPEFLGRDLARYRGMLPPAVRAAAIEWLTPGNRVVLSVVPSGRSDLAVNGSRAVAPRAP